MPLKQQIVDQTRDAMKAKDSVRVGCLRLLSAAIKNKEIEKRGELDDAECARVLATLAKQRGESIEMYKRGARQDLVDKEEAELRIIQSFLPKPLSDEELATLVGEAVAETGASSPADMGKVMKALAQRTAGRVDGKKLSEAVKARLSEKQG
ncbi:MAG: GatB/YqeY domain-containing protein [Proteobacteria bacterium]|nr:GatB/YqeY domain-containing protein [Pseudomonadota bacterium]